MGHSLTDERCGHRPWAAVVVVASFTFIAPTANSLAADPPARRGADAAAEDVDPGTKKLLAAQGLYQRGLYKPAAEAYAEFLAENPKHAQRTAAVYALALCQYRQNDFDRAA